MPNAAPRPWRMFLPLGIVVSLALLWTVYWFVASAMAKDRLAEERAKLAQQGLSLTCTSEVWGGYPFHFEFSCGSPVVTWTGKAEVRSQKLLLVALAYAPWQVAVLLDGPTALTAPGIAPTRIAHERALAAITAGKTGDISLSADLPAIAIDGVGRIGKLMLHTRPGQSGGTEVAVSLSDLDYEPADKPHLAIDSGSLRGTLALDGVLTLDNIELRQGELRYWGSGTVSLDDSRRITGQIDTETNDIKALLAAIGPHIDLSDGQLANLRTMLGLLGNAAKAPVIARQGILYLGPFKIAELAPLI